WHGGHRFSLNGALSYEKPFGFRFVMSSFLSKELDLGSNDEHFWYWSKRDRTPGLYWAKYEDYNKTRLKAPFNPMFMRASLGLEPIEIDVAVITESDDDIRAMYPQVDSMGNPIFFSTIINKERKEIDGYLIFNKDGTILASCEIQEKINGL